MSYGAIVRLCKNCKREGIFQGLLNRMIHLGILLFVLLECHTLIDTFPSLGRSAAYFRIFNHNYLLFFDNLRKLVFDT